MVAGGEREQHERQVVTQHTDLLGRATALLDVVTAACTSATPRLPVTLERLAYG
jgi:hypothetical protein